MRKFSEYIPSVLVSGLNPETSGKLFCLYDDLCMRISMFKNGTEDRLAAEQFINSELSALKDKYYSQPVHFTQEFSVFRFMDINVGTVANADFSDAIQEQVLYWLLFRSCIICLVQTVRLADEAEINKVQRTIDRICNGCGLI